MRCAQRLPAGAHHPGHHARRRDARREALPQLGEEELKEYAKKRLGGYKYPREIRIIPQVPLTPVGKVDRKALRALANREE